MISLTGRVPPLDGVVERARELLRVPVADLAQQLAQRLAERTGARHVELRRSGRDALRVAFEAAAEHTGRSEAVLPAFTCWSVAAAAVAAGLRVRLVDVDANGALDVSSLARLPLERAACVVATNLFGIAEPLGAVAEIARASGAWLVDDAAQSFGARASDGGAGTRGELGILSFGRGKPLQALGGGALLWFEGAPRASVAASKPSPARAWLQAKLWNTALTPIVFRALAAVPLLRVGETRFDPTFARGAMSGDALVLCMHELATCDGRRERRVVRVVELARELTARTQFTAILPPDTASGAFPRLAIRAPDHARREAAVTSLTRFGAARVYPAPLDELPALRPRLVGSAPNPRARSVSQCFFTLPTHAGLGTRQRYETLAVLERLAPSLR